MAFSIGQSVEICSKEDGFVVSFHRARVIERLDEGLYKVQQINLFSEDKSGRLEEIVSGDDLRPEPRRRLPAKVSMFQEFDVSDNEGGWWVGKITGKMRGPKYRVHLYHSGKHMVCTCSHLRIHEDWIDGKWVPSKNARYY